ncbi:MAG TPA: hypothetical protein VL096_11805, partial [Pirellulaceae bacterium]|nr:hypothetical protein [Pirellulaceae bacterium]
MNNTLDTLMVLIPALPLLAAVLTAILGPKLLKELSHWPIVVGIGGSFICSLLLLLNVNAAQQAADARSEGQQAVAFEHVVRLWTWLDLNDAYQQAPAATAADAYTPPGGKFNLGLDVVLRTDALTAIMLCMVTFIATLVAIFAAGYMHGDRGYWRFFSYVGLFVFSMTMLVSVSNFIMLFVFWEAVGA